MRLVADFENVLPIHMGETHVRRLQVSNCLTHVSLGCVYQGLQAVFTVRHVFLEEDTESSLSIFSVSLKDGRMGDRGIHRGQCSERTFRQMSMILASTCASLSLPNLMTAHRLCIGSIILSDVLQASANRVVFEKFSIVLLKACWAPSVIESASSRIMIL